MSYRAAGRDLAPWVIAFRPRRFAPAALASVGFCAFVAFLFLPFAEGLGAGCADGVVRGGACAGIRYGGWFVFVPLLGLAVTLGNLARRLAGSAHVVVDPAARTLTVHRRRWPRRARSTTVGFDDVTGASLDWKEIYEGDRHVRVRLELASGEELALSDDYYPPQDGYVARVAGEIVAAAKVSAR